MKKHYYILVFVIVVVVAMFSSDLGTTLETLSPIAQGLAMLAFVIPTCLLLFFISIDKKIKNHIRIVAKFGIVFLFFCYVAGLLAEVNHGMFL